MIVTRRLEIFFALFCIDVKRALCKENVIQIVESHRFKCPKFGMILRVVEVTSVKALLTHLVCRMGSTARFFATQAYSNLSDIPGRSLTSSSIPEHFVDVFQA